MNLDESVALFHLMVVPLKVALFFRFNILLNKLPDRFSTLIELIQAIAEDGELFILMHESFVGHQFVVLVLNPFEELFYENVT